MRIVDDLILDPHEFVPGGAELDLSASGFRVLDADFGEADVELAMQRAALGETPVGWHPPDTQTVLKMEVREEGEVDLPTASYQLQQKIGKFNEFGEHWMRRDFIYEASGKFAGSLGRRVKKATCPGLGAWGRGELPDVTLTLLTGPYWYATIEEESGTFESEAGARELIFELAEVLGTSPGLIRIRVTNTGQEDWRGLILAGECRDHPQDATADTTAALAYDATDLTLKGGSVIGGGPAPRVRGVGTVASGTGAISPSLPSGTVKGDLLIMVAESGGATASAEANTALTATGWSSPPSPYAAQKKGNTRLTLLYRIATGEDPTTTNDTGDHQMARIIAIEAGTFDTAAPFNTAGVGTQAATKAVSIPGATTTRERCLILACASGHLPDSTSTTEFGSSTNASLTELTERVDNTTAEGDGGALYVVSGVKDTKGAYNATTCTATTEAERGVISLAIAPLLVVEHAELTAGWLTLLNSEIVAEELGHMTHLGVRRPWIRAEDPGEEIGDVQLKLRWRALGSVQWSENRIVPLNIVGGYQLYDLGECRPEGAVLGDQRWEWEVQARAVSGSGVVRLHRVEVLPTEQFCVLKAPGVAQAAEFQSQKSPGTMKNNAGGGEKTWSNVDNAKISDNAYATAGSFTNQGLSQILEATNFAFGLPEGAIVLGVVAVIERKSSASTPYFVDSAVMLIVGGVIQAGVNKASPSPWPTSDGVAVYGGASDLWGQSSLTTTDTNASDFGLILQVRADGSFLGASITASVDSMGLVLYYTEANDENRICFAGRAMEFRTDGIFRQHPTDDVWGEISPGGFLPVATPSGLEGRGSRFTVIPSQGDLGELPDSGDNALSAQTLVRPAYLFAREAA